MSRDERRERAECGGGGIIVEFLLLPFASPNEILHSQFQKIMLCLKGGGNLFRVAAIFARMEEETKISDPITQLPKKSSGQFIIFP